MPGAVDGGLERSGRPCPELRPPGYLCDSSAIRTASPASTVPINQR